MFAFFLVAGPLLAAPPAGVPEKYSLLYEQDVATEAGMKDFTFTDPAAWKFAPDATTPAMWLFKQSEYKPPHRSPFNFALIGGKKFGNAVVEARMCQDGMEYPHRDMVVVFGYQNPAQFYYVHIASAKDDHANNIFIVNKADRTKISKTANDGNKWGAVDAWHTVRVERTVGDGAIKIYFDDLKTPIMTAEDKTFGPGWVGFGSFDDTGKVAKVKVWGDKAEDVVVPKFGK
jgi:hypothetical protein